MTDADLQQCRALLRGGSRSFYAASFLLPPSVRAPACALYAFCRIADDAIDVAGGDRQAVADLNTRITAAYAGAPRAVAYDRAFAATVHAFGIPRALPDALIEGFAWDVSQRRYQTLDDLLGYAARVAGTVGAMMCLLMGRRDAETLAHAVDLGMAMQLTNVARDVGEDARAGRLYLPLSWCREEGLDVEAWMANPVFCPEIGRCVARLLDAAADLYARGNSGIVALPSDCRRGIRAASLLYANIGHEVVRRGHDSVSSRAAVSGSRKIAILSAVLTDRQPTVMIRRSADCRASRFLIDAVLMSPAPLQSQGYATAGHGFRWWKVHTHGVRIIELLENLERRQRQASANRAQSYSAYSANPYAGEAQSS